MILLFTSAIASAFAECRRELERLHFFRNFSVFLLSFNKLSSNTSGEFICFNTSLLFCWHNLSFCHFSNCFSKSFIFFLSSLFLSLSFSLTYLFFCSNIMLLYFFVLSWPDIGDIFIFHLILNLKKKIFINVNQAIHNTNKKRNDLITTTNINISSVIFGCFHIFFSSFFTLFVKFLARKNVEEQCKLFIYIS